MLLESVQELVHDVFLRFLAHLDVRVVAGVERALEVVDFDRAVAVTIEFLKCQRYDVLALHVHVALKGLKMKKNLPQLRVKIRRS